MVSNVVHVNNGLISDIFCPPPDDVKSLGENAYKSLVTLPLKTATADDYMNVIKKIHDSAPNPLPNRKSHGQSPYIQLTYDHQGYHQIETNLEPQELLGALWTSGLINQEEMMTAYKELGLSPQNNARGSGLSSPETPNHFKSSGLPSFSF